MKKIRLFFTTLMVLLATGVAFAQSGEVTGVVKDAGTGETVAGASILVKGTRTGTSAGGDGSYSVNVSDRNTAVLVVSFVGYKTQEVAVAGRNMVDVSLEMDATALEDVIVVAYGTQKKEAVTGSVSSVKGDGLAEVPVTSVDKMLAGKLAGVNITSVSGQPGASSQIRIRGTGSINAGNAPLWVVDGIPIISGDDHELTNTSSTVAMLNPNDIESITILKDAAAAAAYGSRAANGVILVTTKSGREGEAQFEARAKFGVNWLQSDTGFGVMSASELLGYQRDAIYNAGLDPDDPTGSYYRPLSILNQTSYSALNEFLRVGKLQEYEVSARGGNARAKFFSSVSLHKSEGIAYGIGYNRVQTRVNTSYKLLDNLETGVRVNAGYTDQDDVPMQSLYFANPIWAGETILPWSKLKNDDGSWNIELPNNSDTNPRATAIYDDQWQKTYHMNGTWNLKWTPVKNLEIETKDSAELSFIRGRRYWSKYSKGGQGRTPTLQATASQTEQFTTSNTISYSNIFGGYHNFHAVIGQEAMKYQYQYSFVYAPGVNESIPYEDTAPQTSTEAEYGITRETMLSFFGIADYNYDNRYFAQASVREDGSSLFGEKNKWGLFWSVSGSWNIANEKWFRSAVRPVNLLKIRASYGVNGNNGFAAYRAYGLYGTIAYNGYSGYYPSQLENNELSWEKNKTWNVGLDFGLFDSRITGSVDVYSRKTVDLLLTKSIPQTSGFSSIFSNVGSMRNNGVELQLDAEIIRTSDMLWTIGGNIAFNRTKILDLGDDEFLGTWLRNVKGMSMYNYYLYDYAGVNPSTGNALWYDANGALTESANKARRVYAGSPEPKAIGGFNTAFSWKGLTLSAFFEFKAGNKVMMLDERHYLMSDGAQMDLNQLKSLLSYWKKPGDTGVNPKPVAGNTSQSEQGYNTRWLEDGSYLRVKDVTLSYSLPSKWVGTIGLKGVKVYVSGLNLYCFNDVDFWDPEQGVQGFTSGQYPLTKSIVGGIEVTF